MKLNSKIALSMLILLGLGCAKKKSNSNNDAPKTSTESSAASAPLPNPEPKTMPEVVENAKAAAAEVSEAAEAVIEEVKKAPEAPGKNSTKDDDITKLTELKNATDAVKNEDPKKLEETLSNPKLDALSWDLFVNDPQKYFDVLGQQTKEAFDKFGQDTKKAFDDAGQEIKNTFENDVKPALQTADKEAHDALNQSVGDLPVPGVGNVPVSIGMLAGGSIIVVSAAVGLGSYFKDRSPLSKEQKQLLKDFHTAEAALTNLKIKQEWLNDKGAFKENVPNGNSEYTLFKRKYKIGSTYAVNTDHPIHTVSQLEDQLVNNISSLRRKIGMNDSLFLDENRFITQEELIQRSRNLAIDSLINDIKLKHTKTKISYIKRMRILVDSHYDPTLSNPEGTTVGYDDFLTKLSILRTQIVSNPTSEQKSFIENHIKNDVLAYKKFQKRHGISPNQTLANKNKLNPRLDPTKPRSTLNKLGIGGGLAGILAGGGLMAYTQLGGNMFGLAESEARTRLKKALEALSEVESQLWEVREAQGIGE